MLFGVHACKNTASNRLVLCCDGVKPQRRGEERERERERETEGIGKRETEGRKGVQGWRAG